MYMKKVAKLSEIKSLTLRKTLVSFDVVPDHGPGPKNAKITRGRYSAT